MIYLMRFSKENEMRRLRAAGIDFVICYILSVIVYFMMISAWKMLRIIMGRDFDKQFLPLVILLFLLSGVFTNIIYSVFFDSVFHGNTLGKRMAGYKIYATGEKNRNWILKHALARTVASVLYVITALYYISTSRMPYDKICGINSETE